MKHIAILDQTKGILSLRQPINRETVGDLLPSTYHNERGRTGIAAINGSLFDTGKTEAVPYGVVYYAKGTIKNPCTGSYYWIDMIYDGQTMVVDGSLSSDTWIGFSGFACIKNGEADTRKHELHSHLISVQPRTAIGQKENGDIVMFVTDGRPDGMTAAEVTEYLLSMGVINAILLDGGGSSAMYINGEMINDNENRKVANALVFYSTENYEGNVKKMKACINPAHLIATPGKCTPADGVGNVIHESEQNFPVAFEVVRQLEHNGVETVITETDMYKDLPDKGIYSSGANADMYNRIHFEQASGADIYVSLHKNASSDYNWNTTRGVSTHIYAKGGNAEVLAEYVQDRVVKYSGDPDRGVVVQNLAETRETISPAIVCELGFMTNIQDAEDMLNEMAHYVYACAVAHGVCDYFGIDYDKLSKEEDESPTIDTDEAETIKAQIKALTNNIMAECDQITELAEKL